MNTYVGLLRGVNVGGAAKLPMADLRRIAEACGFTDVRTYVQSGNVVFRTSASAAKAAKALREALAAGTNVDPALALRTPAQLAAVVDDCPFDDTAHVHVTFLVEGASPRALTVERDRFAPEQAAAHGREVYLYLPDGIGRSKLAAVLARGTAGAEGTTRNWRTVTTLLGLAREA
jgi:uncharacterized protein (DUF1697 family)